MLFVGSNGIFSDILCGNLMEMESNLSGTSPQMEVTCVPRYSDEGENVFFHCRLLREVHFRAPELEGRRSAVDSLLSLLLKNKHGDCL
ncbi:hypothetical protein CDAR_462101 [Caerostris darwini]|uniref:Uncharacterized protein n=1 Tax=Caerostris darwini TaxID=1538125 RepID=A0AAV4TJ75_9ARAC|nr:hypothetical protein CDAR_462101 [Caerostris darwini]